MSKKLSKKFTKFTFLIFNMIIMTPEETYESIKSILTDITNRSGTANINIGIVNDVAQLPRRIPKLGVWYLNSANDAKAIL